MHRSAWGVRRARLAAAMRGDARAAAGGSTAKQMLLCAWGVRLACLVGAMRVGAVHARLARLAGPTRRYARPVLEGRTAQGMCRCARRVGLGITVAAMRRCARAAAQACFQAQTRPRVRIAPLDRLRWVTRAFAPTALLACSPPAQISPVATVRQVHLVLATPLCVPVALRDKCL